MASLSPHHPGEGFPAGSRTQLRQDRAGSQGLRGADASKARLEMPPSHGENIPEREGVNPLEALKGACGGQSQQPGEGVGPAPAHREGLRRAPQLGGGAGGPATTWSLGAAQVRAAAGLSCPSSVPLHRQTQSGLTPGPRRGGGPEAPPLPSPPAPLPAGPRHFQACAHP